MADENKTEQATPQRRRKAREKGQVARSRELASSLAVIAALAVIASRGESVLLMWRRFFGSVLDTAATSDMTVGSRVFERTVYAAAYWCVPPILVALFVVTAASFAQGGIVFATEALSLNAGRLSPSRKISELFSATSLTALLKSLIPFSCIGVIAYQLLARDWPVILTSHRGSPRVLFVFLAERSYELVWKSGLVLLLWSGADYLLIRQKHERDLRMSREEIREEVKESEGNPQTKAQMRRMQRRMRRKQMLRDVGRSTVVVTNPTHFAIALEYTPDMAAPVVVAKGRDLLAQQIKNSALWHGIPTIENPPLAHALYRTVEVGQAIPAKLFAAVAEILAFVYRTQQKLAQARGR